MLLPGGGVLFYGTFGVVVTVFVRIAGVLLVFSYLIAPAVCAVSVARSVSMRLLIGWAVSLVGSIAGLMISFWWDLPSGAAIVCTLGAMLALTAFRSLFPD